MKSGCEGPNQTGLLCRTVAVWRLNSYRDVELAFPGLHPRGHSIRDFRGPGPWNEFFVAKNRDQAPRSGDGPQQDRGDGLHAFPFLLGCAGSGLNFGSNYVPSKCHVPDLCWHLVAEMESVN